MTTFCSGVRKCNAICRTQQIFTPTTISFMWTQSLISLSLLCCWRCFLSLSNERISVHNFESSVHEPTHYYIFYYEKLCTLQQMVCRMVITYSVVFVTIYSAIICTEDVFPLEVVVFPVWTHIAMSCCNRKISVFISDLLPLSSGRQWTASTRCHSVQVTHPAITSLLAFIKEAHLGIFLWITLATKEGAKEIPVFKPNSGKQNII